jgi:hypothetical protein
VETAVIGKRHVIRKVLQSEWWGAPLVQEEKYQAPIRRKYQEDENIFIITIFIISTLRQVF